MYVYHWPVEEVLRTAGAVALGVVGFVVLALTSTLLLALASWHGVEAPALARKDAPRVTGRGIDGSGRRRAAAPGTTAPGTAAP